MTQAGTAMLGRRFLAGALLAGALAIAIGFAARPFLAYRYRQAADPALQRHDLRRALRHLERSLAQQPNHAQTRWLAAQTTRRLDRYADAVRHLEAYERLQPGDKRSEREWFLQGVQQGDIAGQERYLRYLAERFPEEAPFIVEAMAKGYLNAFCWPDAIDCLTESLARWPDHVPARVLRARAYEGVRQAELALADYRQAVAEAPHCFEARAGLAAALHESGFNREALAHFEFLQAESPDEPAVLLGLARAGFDHHDLERARHLLQRLGEQHPEFVPGLVEAGRLALYEQRWADAEQLLARARELAPAHLETNRLLELLYDARGEASQRSDLRQRLQQLHADDRQLVRMLDRCRDVPRDVRVRYDIGAWKHAHDDEPDGLRWWFSSLFVDEHFAPTHEALAAYFERTGQAYWAAHHRERLRSRPLSAQARP
jgi:Tfp pilus assembly protein PilF